MAFLLDVRIPRFKCAELADQQVMILACAADLVFAEGYQVAIVELRIRSSQRDADIWCSC